MDRKAFTTSHASHGHTVYDEEIEMRAAAVERVNAMLRQSSARTQVDTDADLSSRYGLDLEAREAVNEKFQETMAAIDARLAEEYSAKLGPDTRRLMEEHERHLEEEREALASEHAEWSERELDRRRQQLREAAQERLHTLQTKVDEATRAALDKAASEEEELTAKELEELEKEAGVAKEKAVKELERRWEERQGRDKGRIEKEVRQKQVLGTAHQLEAMQREKAATLSTLEEDLSAQATSVCEAARREFWATQGEALRGLERLREACVERIRQEVKAQVGEVGLRPVEEVVGTQLGDVRQRVLRRMQKGSFLAEEEYARLLEAEPKIRDAQRRYVGLVDRLVELLGDVTLLSSGRALQVTPGTVRRLLREHAARAALTSSGWSEVSNGMADSRASEDPEEDSVPLVGDLRMDDLLRVVSE